MKVFVAQLNFKIGDFSQNLKKILSSIDLAKKDGADIVLFPELSLCGYPPEDFLLQRKFIEKMESLLPAIIDASKGLFVVVGLVRKNLSGIEKPLFNSAAVISDGKLLGYHDKCLLPTYDVFDEKRYFEPGKDVRVFEFKGKKIGVIICEDIWQHSGFMESSLYCKDPIVELSALQPDLVLNLSASPYDYNKPDVRKQVCLKASKTLHCPVILCCQVGGNDQLVFDGYSVVVDKNSQIIRLGKGFEEDAFIVDLSKNHPPVQYSAEPIEDLYRALVLGVRDYFHKSGFKKGCLGLSGGIDSALVACIAAEALGRENVLAISMPSRYSSDSSVSDAEQIAQTLGIEYQEISIEKPFATYLDLLEPYFQGKEPDVTEENLQARIRGMILMAFSNKFGYVVLSTGNKSEMAMGYCTLYGDMCGGLSVIADVSKTLVYKLSRWINRNKEIIPWSTIDKPPSAELRPNQKDSDSLPDYEIIDLVLQSYIEEYLSPEEIVAKHKFPIELVMDLVKRTHRAEYKRRQAAPGIRVTKKSFRKGREYPIVQGWV
jgi:NAD+ synthase (glutamine-hydrolysing)